MSIDLLRFWVETSDPPPTPFSLTDGRKLASDQTLKVDSDFRDLMAEEKAKSYQLGA
jgi:hypothetical protein